MNKKEYSDYYIRKKNSLKRTIAKVYGKDERLLIEKTDLGYYLIDKATGMTLINYCFPYVHYRIHMKDFTSALDCNSIDDVYDKYLKEKYEERIKQKDYAKLCLEYQKLVKKYMEDDKK